MNIFEAVEKTMKLLVHDCLTDSSTYRQGRELCITKFKNASKKDICKVTV